VYLLVEFAVKAPALYDAELAKGVGAFDLEAEGFGHAKKGANAGLASGLEGLVGGVAVDTHVFVGVGVFASTGAKSGCPVAPVKLVFDERA
jgi:hypothetical protein